MEGNTTAMIRDEGTPSLSICSRINVGLKSYICCVRRKRVNRLYRFIYLFIFYMYIRKLCVKNDSGPYCCCCSFCQSNRRHNRRTNAAKNFHIIQCLQQQLPPPHWSVSIIKHQDCLKEILLLVLYIGMLTSRHESRFINFKFFLYLYDQIHIPLSAVEHIITI